MEDDSSLTGARVGNSFDTRLGTVPLIEELRSSTKRTSAHPASALSNKSRSGFSLEQRSIAAFSRLPPEVIERILYTVDANSFASLSLLNREWRRVSDSAKLYRYHLAYRRGYSPHGLIASSSLMSDDLPNLKRKFVIEARRNVFEVFRRPRKTLVNLISISASSSSAFPQGEAFRFIFSARGRYLLGLSSSRIFVIDLTTDPITVCHELKTLRRPVTAAILDDASLLAVVSSEHQAHIYNLSGFRVKLIQTIVLNQVPRTVALSPQGTVVAFAYDGGIEVHALGERALSTDRRAVRCFDVDALSFSSDGSTLVGSSANAQNIHLVTISPALSTYMDNELSLSEMQSRMWTTQILFPDISVGYSHVSLVPSDDGCAASNDMVGYDSQLRVFRLSQIDDVRSGYTYFVGPGSDGEKNEPEPNIMPAASARDGFLALGFQDSGIWLYGMPQAMEGGQDERSSRRNTLIREQSWNFGAVRTNSQRLKKMINPPRYLVHGYHLTPITDATAAQWVNTSDETEFDWPCSVRRLVAVAPGGVSSGFPSMGNENPPVDGGRIIIFDFERSPNDGEAREITVEVGEMEPKDLPERDSNMDTEVELERRRTQVNRHGGLGMSRSAAIQRSTSVARHHPTVSTSVASPTALGHRHSISQPNSPIDHDSQTYLQVFDNPYNNTQPRSRDTLSRAATAAATNRRHRYPDGGFAPPRRYGNRAHLVPHESDADNWEPPPPPYSPDADSPLPDHIRRTLLPSMTMPIAPRLEIPQPPRRSQTSILDTMAQTAVQRTRSTAEHLGSRVRPSRARTEHPPPTLGGRSSLDQPAAIESRLYQEPEHFSSNRVPAASMQHQVTDPFPHIPTDMMPQPTYAPASASTSAPTMLAEPRTNIATHTSHSLSSTTVYPPLTTGPLRKVPALSGAALQQRLERPTPPLPRDDSHSGQPIQPAVIGRNGPRQPLSSEQDSQYSTPSSLPHATGQRRLSQSPSTGRYYANVNQVTASPSRRMSSDIALAPSTTSQDPIPQNVPSHAPLTRNRPQALPAQGLRRLDTIYSVTSVSDGVRRSRSQSQDIPRAQPLVTSGLFDRRTGRKISSSQSEQGFGRYAKTEDLRERVGQWTQLANDKKKRDSKCIIM
ncbi:hypothetical protein AJ80_08591 [Polytolypa hystricis UAMH7299]|uniref:F-box domain-containing protein n=1 Tax=Polytolypa hystricis (strain UAMH7299) TaxID=1447883 RepID=A0A2B7X5I7_POLH7|nr:hypothetical protein AJ80_08591 [Polytolypa hystricis UAMH7299]